MKLRSLLLLATSFLTLAVAQTRAADITFGGGKGSPLTITFNSTFSFTQNAITVGSTNLILQGLTISGGTESSNLLSPVTGLLQGVTDTLRITSPTITLLGNTLGSIPAHSLVIGFSNAAISLGNTYTIAAGQTLTTTTNWSGDPSTFNTSISAYMASSLLNTPVSTSLNLSASAIPEPSTYAALLGLVGLGAAVMFKRSKRVAV